ncbi:MAG: thioredoxin domain-containing protein [Alphaproteobacteria bacterium]|nr:thioredoxin domain-containing protein [Alphaproteobacteria bacterium]
MLKSHAGTAVGGALAGAVLAVGTVFAAASFGIFPDRPDDHIRAYLLAHPQILAEMSSKLQTQQEAGDDAAREKAVRKLGLKPFFNPRLAFVTGPASARTTFVEFFDYNCPYCRASIPAVKKFMAAHKNDTRFAFIEFPIKGPRSTIASRAAIAARKQPGKYLAFHFLLMDEKELVTKEVILADAQKAGLDVGKLLTDMRDHSVDTAIAGAHNLAAAANIDGTPAFIVNGRIREGALDDDSLREMLRMPG